MSVIQLYTLFRSLDARHNPTQIAGIIRGLD